VAMCACNVFAPLIIALSTPRKIGLTLALEKTLNGLIQNESGLRGD